MNNQEINDVAKETLTVLSYFDDNLIKKIPEKFLDYLRNLASTSNYVTHVDVEKKLVNQDISEESKDLIALIYYSYIADEEEKKEIIKSWNENERLYEKQLEEKYNLNNLFKNKAEKIYEEDNILPIEFKEKSIFHKILDFIKNVFKK